MLVAQLSDQLGNQMFCYAAIKTIALDNGYGFKCYNDHTTETRINSVDTVYGSKVSTIFDIPQKETITELPVGISVFREITDIYSKSALVKDALTIDDNTLMQGHYICPQYFIHRIEEVREWFCFPKSVNISVLNSVQAIRAKHTGKQLVSVHFRNADDYKNGGFLLQKRYWYRAAQKILDINPNSLFVVFYDKKTIWVEDFIRHYSCEIIHSSLVFDLCAISYCDHHIVCNSSFSIMGALLDSKRETVVIRPSKFPVPDGYMPEDMYLKNWITVKGKRDWNSEIKRRWKLKYRIIKRFLKNKIVR